MQFEYKVYTPKAGTSPEYEQEVVYSFNTLGAEGWELTAMDGAFFIFKRPKEESGPPHCPCNNCHAKELGKEEQPCTCPPPNLLPVYLGCPKHDA
jgi:hypothetical protein